MFEGFVGRDDHEQPPQAVAIVQLGEPALPEGPEEAVKGILDDVLFVGRLAGGRAEFFAG
jgi:hypothetical protein